MTLRSCNASRHRAERGGGFAYAELAGELDVLDSLIESSVSPQYGGAVLCESSEDATLPCATFRGSSRLVSNNAARGGAVAAVLHSLVRFESGIWLESNAAEVAGAVLAADDAVVEAGAAQFRNNSASSSGGAVAVADDARCVGCPTPAPERS